MHTLGATKPWPPTKPTLNAVRGLHFQRLWVHTQHGGCPASCLPAWPAGACLRGAHFRAIRRSWPHAEGIAVLARPGAAGHSGRWAPRACGSRRGATAAWLCKQGRPVCLLALEHGWAHHILHDLAAGAGRWGAVALGLGGPPPEQWVQLQGE